MVRNSSQRHNRLIRAKHHNLFYEIHAKSNINTEVFAELENHDIRKIHQLTSYESNIQFDQFSSARQVVKSIRDNKVDKICTQLTSQKCYNQSMGKRIGLSKSNWFSFRDKMPSNIYNFVNRYLNNSLPTLKNMLLWGTSNSMSCLDCGNSQTLHVMSG